MASLTHQTIDYVKGAGAGIEKRVLDKIKSIEKYIHCCIDKVETVHLVASSGATKGNWQAPLMVFGTGFEIIAAPGAGYINVITKVVTTYNGDQTDGGGTTGYFILKSRVSGDPVTDVIAACPPGALPPGGFVNATSVGLGLALDATQPNVGYTVNAGTFLDVTSAAVAPVFDATCTVQVYYKTVAIK
jgi:hypothetical protein